MKRPVRRQLLAVAVSGLFAWPHAAQAGLGAIEVLSAPGEAFTALIPFVDDMPGEDAVVSLADRNRYPMLSPYSSSAGQLHFTLQKSVDGKPTGILVFGPEHFAEKELDFAVALRWASGGAVREYQVSERHAAAGQKKRTPAPAPDRKPSLLPSVHGGHGHVALGDLKVLSQAREPLLAEAPLLGVAPADTARLKVRVSPLSAAGKPSAETLSLLSSMRYSVISGPDGSRVLQLISTEALMLPRLDFRLDVRLDEARLVRHYQLDAKDLQIVVSEQAEPAATTDLQSERTGADADGRFLTWRVQPKESLSSIASRLRPDSLSLASVMQRLYRNNPEAFIAGDINRLRAGVLLRYPAQWSPRQDAATPDASPASAAAAGQPAVVQLNAPLPGIEDSQSRLADLRAKLAQQERQLSDADTIARSLEKKLQALQQQKSVAAPPVVKARSSSSMVAATAAGGILLAAAVTALALRRRHQRLQAQQAEGLDRGTTVEGMRQWLRYDPTRDDLRYRLLLLLASQNDREGFIEQAEMARSRFDAGGEMWQGVLRMGRELAPDHDWERRATVVAPAAAAMPERPLRELGGLDELADDLVVFRDAAVDFDTAEAPELPQPIDQKALALLFQEMGDHKSAQEMARHPGS
ncbi:FimV family protein [Paludibacterium sp. B53371]|uniref:type IV pilus assembly protein FimV n=1 Tax=Paludibacterium sp. B53371 TaxID=2806263 RepID=UPI001C051924|nr:FimV/HubP family polar landmark protein [Paludibacterium sp. B53371]